MHWPGLVLVKALIKTRHRSNVSIISLLNKDPEALIDHNSFCALTPIPACAPYFFFRFSFDLRAIYESLLEKLKKLIPISVAFALLLSILLVLTGLRPRFSSSFYQKTIQTTSKKSIRSRDSGSSGVLRVTFQAKWFKLLLQTLGPNRTQLAASLMQKTVV